MSNIVFFSHGSRTAWKAMSKTARGCGARAIRASQQHPAILPWPSSPGLSGTISLRPALVRRRCRRTCNSGGNDAIRSTRAGEPAQGRSTADTKLVDQTLVAPLVGAHEIVEQLAALGHELQQASPRMVVFHMGFEMFGQSGDPLRQDRYLDLRRPG